MRLTYIYHSCFALEGDGFTILIDYCRDTPDGLVHRAILTRPGRLYVLATHFHADHFAPEVLSWRAEKPDIVYLLSRDIRRRRRVREEMDVTFMCKGDVYRDEFLALRAFGSTDEGISFYLECSGLKIFHAGDLNNWHWTDESTSAEVREAEAYYLRELAELRRAVPALDVAMFPLDPRMGSDFARGARQLLENIQIRIFVPMHFWERPEEVRFFRAEAEARGAAFCLLAEDGEGIDIV